MNPLLAFYIGTLIQSIFLIGYNFEKKDFLKFLGCLGFGILALAPGEKEYVYDHFFHLLLMAVFFAGAYAFIFKKKLLREINRDVLLLWNLIFIYIILRTPYLSGTLLVVTAGLLSLPSLVNIFYRLDKRYIWRVYFYIWFLFMIVSISLSHTTFSNLSFFVQKGSNMPTDSLKMFLLGASCLYIVTNLLYLLELIPFTGKHQSMSSRLREIREDMALMASRYEPGNQIWSRPFTTLALTTGLLCLNYFFNYLNDSSLIYLLIALTPVIDRFLFKEKNTPGIEPIEPNVIVDPDTQIETILQ